MPLFWDLSDAKNLEELADTMESFHVQRVLGNPELYVSKLRRRREREKECTFSTTVDALLIFQKEHSGSYFGELCVTTPATSLRDGEHFLCVNWGNIFRNAQVTTPKKRQGTTKSSLQVSRLNAWSGGTPGHSGTVIWARFVWRPYATEHLF